MSQQTWSDYCPGCQRMKRFVRDLNEPPHVVYALLTIFTCGCWGFVWMIHSLCATPGPWFCVDCGSLPGHPPVPTTPFAPQFIPQPVPQPVQPPVPVVSKPPPVPKIQAPPKPVKPKGPSLWQRFLDSL